MAPVCRHSLFSEHFSAPYPPDGNPAGEEGCDVCLGETKGLPEDEARLTAKKVLSAAWRAEGRYGTGYVVNLLLGRLTGNRRFSRLCFLRNQAGEPCVHIPLLGEPLLKTKPPGFPGGSVLKVKSKDLPCCSATA